MAADHNEDERQGDAADHRSIPASGAFLMVLHVGREFRPGVLDLEHIVSGEQAENIERKDLTPPGRFLPHPYPSQEPGPQRHGLAPTNPQLPRVRRAGARAEMR
jgi:hypothetical protein